MHRLHMLKRRRASYAKVETAGERPSPLAKLMPPDVRGATMVNARARGGCGRWCPGRSAHRRAASGERGHMSRTDYLKQAKARSDAELEALANATSYDEVYARLKTFITCRYLIDDGFWSDDVNELAEHSIALRLSSLESGDSLGDLSMNCAGASSVETKYALLLITLRKSLNLTIEPVQATTLDTVPLLATEIARQLAQRRSAC